MKKILKLTGISISIALLAYIIYAYHPEQDKAFAMQKYSYPDSHFITINNVEIHYRIVGNGPDLVLLHGWGGNMRHFDSIVPALTKHYRVILIDCLGQGLTDPEPENNYSNERNMSFIEDIFDTLKLSHFSIAGNSTGAYWAMLYAKKYPQKTDKLILINPRGGDCDKPEKTTANSFNPEDLPFVSQMSLYLLPRSMVKQTLQALFADPDKVSDELVQTTFDIFSIKGKRMLRKHFASYPHPNDILTGIATPALIIAGDKDNTHTVCQCENLKQKLPASKMETLKNTGHLAMIENPSATTQLMLDFLK